MFVDNIKIIRARNSRIINLVKEKLTAVFEIIDMELISFGLKVSQNHERKTIKLSQLVYINKILVKFQLSQDNTSNIPMK